nr:MAG TPA: protein of unknown function (DUF4464) [Caudoviricetes sp.]
MYIPLDCGSVCMLVTAICDIIGIAFIIYDHVVRK